jgi:hypothetical protein
MTPEQIEDKAYAFIQDFCDGFKGETPLQKAWDACQAKHGQIILGDPVYELFEQAVIAAFKEALEE